MRRVYSVLLAAIFIVQTTGALASPGHPVAVRWWGQAMVSIETYWNLTIVIDPYGDQIGYRNPNVAGDLVLISHEHRDHNNAELIAGEPIVERGLDSEGRAQAFSKILDRMPGTETPKWFDARLRMARSDHAIQVTSVPAWHDETKGNERGANTLFVIDVDGVRIVHCGDLGQAKLTEEQLHSLGDVDVLLIPVGGTYTVDGKQAGSIVGQIQPRIVVPIHYKTPNLIYDLQGVQGFLESVAEQCEVHRANGNTLAVSATGKDIKTEKPRAVVLDFLPWEMPKELSVLFKSKDSANEASQAVFAKLTANQMNFKPGDGTHTPRWNAEHMMGRELLFFSQIYAQRDSAIAVLDLNPKQMPPDYVAAHPEWTGEEEALQMERVSAFTRRFAYLLDGLALDEKAPGSRWTPRGLLEQMARHYGEHTANVKKKFALPDWPSAE